MTDLDVAYIARLARLELTEEETVTFSKQLEHVLAYCDKIKNVDVKGVEPMSHAWPMVNVWGEDIAGGCFSQEEALLNAPEQRDQQFVVPQVVEQSL